MADKDPSVHDKKLCGEQDGQDLSAKEKTLSIFLCVLCALCGKDDKINHRELVGHRGIQEINNQ